MDPVLNQESRRYFKVGGLFLSLKVKRSGLKRFENISEKYCKK